MIHFKFVTADLRNLYLTIDDYNDEIALDEAMLHFNLIDPNSKYIKNFQPKPVEFMYKFYQKASGKYVYYASINLWQEFHKYFKEHDILYDGLIECSNLFKRPIQHTFDEFKSIVDSWGLAFTPRPYQYETAYKILQWKTSISELATRAGKTLLAYIVFRYALEYLNAHNILMIVPSTDLVKQGDADFEKYGPKFITECIWSKGKHIENANVTVGTFQSLIKYLDRRSDKYNPSFFDKYDIVFVDEVHRATAEQIKTIITQPFMQKLKVAFGLTGTVPEEGTIDRYILAMELGAKIQTIKPKELMDAGYISEIEIHQKILNYTDKEYLNDLYIRAAEYRLADYITERINGEDVKVELEHPEFLFRHKKHLPYGIQIQKEQVHDDESKKNYIKSLTKLVTDSESTNNLTVEQLMVPLLKGRTEYIIKLLHTCERNTLILATHVEYVKYLHEEISRYFPNRKVVMITGKVSSKQRGNINQILKENDNCILVANYATCSTGLTFSGLCYGILAESYKSNVVNMQSLGRGLGLVLGKEKYIVYDLIDKLQTNRIWLQGKAKREIYDKNQYKYTIEQVNV